MFRDDRRLGVLGDTERASEAAVAWTSAFARADGWRMGDGGKSIALVGGRSFWIWGDSFLAPAGQSWRDETQGWHILGSVVALSGRDASRAAGVRFYGRLPAMRGDGSPDVTGAPVVDLSTAAGIEALRAYGLKSGQGAWVWTGGEANGSGLNRWRWPTTGIARGTTLHLLYYGMKNLAPGAAPPPDGGKLFDFEPDGTLWLYTALATDRSPEDWVHLEPKLLTDRGAVTWTAFFDDSEDSGFLYVFGLRPSNVGDLLVARVGPGASLEDYRSWEFLHEAGWVRGDDDVSRLRSIARRVGQEFSIDKVTFRGTTRWVLAHTHLATEGAPLGQADYAAFTSIGIVRLSTSPELTSLPSAERDFYWVPIGDVEPKLNTGIPYGGWLRGFSIHAELSGLPRNGAAASRPSLEDRLPLLFGYTIFDPDFPPKNLWSDPDCAQKEGGRYCGARRFVAIDLARIWPARTVSEFAPSVPRAIDRSLRAWLTHDQAGGRAHLLKNPLWKGPRPPPPVSPVSPVFAASPLNSATLAAASARSLGAPAPLLGAALRVGLHDLVRPSPVGRLGSFERLPPEAPRLSPRGRPVATPALTVWLYGDGITRRMASELPPMLAGTGIRVVDRARETTGPSILLGLLREQLGGAARPDLVFIGYSASALSYLLCADLGNRLSSGALAGTPFAELALNGAATREKGREWGRGEGRLVVEAAQWLEERGIPVLLALGPGASPTTPLAACMDAAHDGAAREIAASGYPYVDWDLRPEGNPKNWTDDGIHESCDPARYTVDWEGKPFADFFGKPGSGCPGYDGATNGARTLARRLVARLEGLRLGPLHGRGERV